MMSNANGKSYDANDILRECGEEGLRESFDRAREPEPNGGEYKSPRITITRFDDIRLNTSPNYIVKGIIPRDGLTTGPPKCGKSFWTFDLTMHVALGRPYRGHRVRQGTVGYIAFEGGSGFPNRVEAWRRRNPINDRDKPVPFYLLVASIKLIADHDELIAAIRAQVADIPSVVVIDTLNRSIDGSENDPADMSKYIEAADAVRRAFGCAVIIVHHCGVGGNRPRGHSSLDGANAAQIAVSKDDKEGLITVTVEHMKDGPSGAVITSKLDEVELGQDDDGDTITSCVIVAADAKAKDPADQIKGSNNQLGYRTLQKLIEKNGLQPPPGHNIPANVRVVPTISWRESFYKAYPADRPDTKQKAFVRVYLKLHELGIIEEHQEFVWIPDKPDKSKNANVRDNSDVSGTRTDGPRTKGQFL